MSEHDNAIPPDCERFMAHRMNAVTESIDGSHTAFIAHPDVASDLILKALGWASFGSERLALSRVASSLIFSALITGSPARSSMMIRG
ncbi:MAG: hypothetical protein WA614_09480 [Acidimicrobiales bacterium]